MLKNPIIKIQADKEEMPKNSVKLKVKVAFSEWNKFEVQVVSQMASNMRLPGFRQGKVPFTLAKNQIEEERVAQEVMEKILPLSYVEALKKYSLKPIGSPQIKIIQFEKDKDFIYEAELSIWPKIKLPDYKKIKVKKPKISLKKEEIKRELEILQRRLADQKVKKDKAELGDRLLISYKGRINGKLVSGLKKEKIWIILEKDVLYPGFGEKLIGKKFNQEVNFDIQVPKGITNQGLAGQKINFWVKILEVRQEIPISLEKVAKKLGHKSKNELEEKIKEFLRQEKEKEAEKEWETKITDELVKKTNIEISPQLVQQETQRLIQQISSELSLRGQSLEQFLAQTKNSKKDFIDNLKKQAEKNLQHTFILNEIAQKEKIKILPKEIKQVLKKEKDSLLAQGYNKEEVEEQINKEEIKTQIETDLKIKKVLNFLKTLNK